MGARVRQIDVGAALVACGAIVLLVSLFLHWYHPGLTAWRVFEALDLVLAAVAIAALAAVATELGAGSFVSPRWLPLLGAIAVVVVIGALVNHPPAAIGHRPDAGIWLALGGSLVLLAGGVLTVARVSIAVTVEPPAPGQRRPLRGAARRPPPPPPPGGPAGGEGEAPTEPLPPEGSW